MRILGDSQVVIVLLAASLVSATVSCGREVSTPEFVIAFEDLGPRWVEWQATGFDAPMIGYGVERKGDSIVFEVLPMGTNTVKFDSYGTQMAPTEDRSVIAFDTHGLKLRWLNDVTFVSQEHTPLYFRVCQESGGLVHLFGEGQCILRNGAKVELRTSISSLTSALDFVKQQQARFPDHSGLAKLRDQISDALNESQ